MRRYYFFSINLPTFILGVVLLFNVGINDVAAAPIKILNNSGHAYGSIGAAINVLLGRAYTASEFVIHYTAASYGTCASDSTFEGFSPIPAISTSTSYVYCDQTGATTTPQLPYQIFSTSFTSNPGDSVSVYNQFATYDITDDYAFTASPTLKTPPAFYTAPGDSVFASAPGVEWKWDTTIYNGQSLSGDTAANTGFMAWLRLNHPTWNWFDVKAAVRQSAANWTTGYNGATYGFGLINATTTNALADNQILLQPPEVSTSTSGMYSQLNFTLYPFRQTRRAKDVLFEFPTNPGIQLGTGGNSDLTLAQIQAMGGGGTKVAEYTGTLATTTTPFYAPVSNAYFVWFTADNTNDTASTTLFSRIDTYSDFGPLSQPDISFSGTFDLASPANNGISSSQTPTFSWNAASSYLGISKYQLYIDGVLNTDNIASTSIAPTGNLAAGVHTWYVKATNGGGTATTTVSTYTLNVIPGYSSPHTFYVDNVLGNDNNVGSQTAPWATLAKAGNTAQAGDTVIIIKNANMPYRENLSPTNGATFEGVDAGHKPEIWGSNDVSNSQGAWTLYSGTTYQKAVAAQSNVVAEGPSISALTKITKGSSAAALNPGQWYWSSGTLYYSLQAGENITTLHIESGARGLVVSGSNATFKNIIVRYANGGGVSLTSSSAEGIEVYDSSNAGINVGTGSTASYCVAAGNGSYGIWSQYSGNVSIYNSLAYGNGASGVDFDTFGGSIMTVLKNNISVGNTSYSFSFNYFFGAPTSFTASNNSWDIAGDSNWNNYKGTNNQELKDSLFTSTSTRDFSLTQFSPDIDAGTPITGLTTDILGNPIYGSPDIGPYEYQPPYSVGTNGTPATGSIRTYGNGKYRMLTATSSATTVNLTVTPSGGFSANNYSWWLDVAVNTWNTTGDHSKSWTESSSVATSTDHTIGDLAPNTFYTVNVDGTKYTTIQADSGGQGTFTYSGGYSTHTFAITQNLAVNNGPVVGASFSLPTPPASVSSPIVPSNTVSATSSTSTPQKLQTPGATSTTATTTPDFSSPVFIKEKIMELQSKLIELLKELIILLTKQLSSHL